MPITDQQVQKIKALVDQLVADKTDADAKTQASNAANTTAQQAQATAAQANLDEAAADAVVSADLSDLTAFLDSLAAPPPATAKNS